MYRNSGLILYPKDSSSFKTEIVFVAICNKRSETIRNKLGNTARERTLRLFSVKTQSKTQQKSIHQLIISALLQRCSMQIARVRTPNRLNLVVYVQHSRGIISDDADLCTKTSSIYEIFIHQEKFHHTRNNSYVFRVCFKSKLKTNINQRAI